MDGDQGQRTGACYFSVIMPVYNGVHFIEDTLESLFAQQFQDFEVIVIDDGSTDGTVELVEQYRDRLTLLHSHRFGPAGARNVGIQAAQGRYLAPLDSDDIWFPWTLACYHEVLTRHGEPPLLVGKEFGFQSEDADQLLQIERQPLQVTPYDDFYALGNQYIWAGSSILCLRRQTVEAVGGFARAAAPMEDIDLLIRLGDQRMVRIRQPYTAGYRVHANNLTGRHATLAPVLHRMLDLEQGGHYPGGRARQRDRRELICNQIRNLVSLFLRDHRFDLAWQLYRRSFGMQLGLGRVGYLVKHHLWAWQAWRRPSAPEPTPAPEQQPVAAMEEPVEAVGQSG